jgi:hypothetical protein
VSTTSLFCARLFPKPGALISAIRWRTEALLKFLTLLLVLAISGLAQAPERPLDLNYRVEWRLIEAGEASLKWLPSGTARTGEAQVAIQSKGLVSKLFPVQNQFSLKTDELGCALLTTLNSSEGSRRRHTQVTYDRASQRVQFREQDLVKNQTIEKEVAIPGCTFDVIAALLELRRLRLEPGAAFSVPISDGKKFVQARVESQAREKVKTPAGEFSTIRCEAFLFDGVLFARKARLHVWFTDDTAKIPVQIRIAMRFYVGTVTLQLTSSR